jgi:hypothetical protein
VKKALTWIAVAIAAIWLVKNPAGAAALAHQIMHALTTLAASL